MIKEVVQEIFGKVFKWVIIIVVVIASISFGIGVLCF